MNDHEVPFSDNEPRLVFQRGREAFYQTEESFTARLDVSAMLDVVGRPVALGRNIVALVEQGIERLKNERFVFRLSRLLHLVLLQSWPHSALASRRGLAAIDSDNLTGEEVHLVRSQKHDRLRDLLRVSSAFHWHAG